MMHRCEKCPRIEALLIAFLNEELEDIEQDGEFHYSQWQTTNRATLVTLTTTYNEYKETLIETIHALNPFLSH